MLSTLIALSSLTLAQATGGQGESVFPKSETSVPAVLKDRSIFQYLTDAEPDVSMWRAPDDWSGLKFIASKPSAIKLRVLFLVFERDFSDPLISNTLELNDKQRLIASMSRISRFFSSMSHGELDVEVIPRFFPDPIFSYQEMEDIRKSEFNQFKFDADDREERGPFAAIVQVSSSSGFESFVNLGGNESGYVLEQNISELICQQLVDRLPARLGYPAINRNSLPRRAAYRSWISATPWLKTNDGIPFQLLDPAFRDDAKLAATIELAAEDVQRASYSGRPTLGAASIRKESDVLVFEESSIIRSAAAVLPQIPNDKLEGCKGLSFEVRTKSSNPISVGWTDTSGRRPSTNYSIGVSGVYKIKTDGTWNAVTIPRNGESVPYIAVPSENFAKTRNPHEVIRYEFRNFKLTSEPVAGPPDAKEPDFESHAGVEQALNSADNAARRMSLYFISKEPENFKSLQPKLLEMSTELEPAVAFGAVQAYGKLGIANDDLIGKSFMNRLVSTAPNEYAREAALLYFAEHPEQTTFEAIAPNIVRRSWRTRIATVKALAALDRTDLKAKPAARQLLLTATGQDMAIIRSAALAAMKPEVELERKQLEYSLVNDPSEKVRLQCLRQLAAANAPKEVLFGCLADDSPYVREHVYEQLPANLQRETLQRMVIDRDTYVRAAALYGFAKLSDPTQPGEIQNTFAEEHPAVLLALVEGAQKGKWKLPANVFENARKSKSPLVREGIAKLALQ